MSFTRRSPLFALLALALALPLLLAACGDSDDDSDDASTDTEAVDEDGSTTTTESVNVNQGASIPITDFQFGEGPDADVTMEAGKAVTWTNDSDIIGHQVKHEATANERSFESPIIGPGESFTETIDQPGTYDYICAIHPDRMTGVLIVEEAA